MSTFRRGSTSHIQFVLRATLALAVALLALPLFLCPAQADGEEVPPASSETTETAQADPEAGAEEPSSEGSSEEEPPVEESPAEEPPSEEPPAEEPPAGEPPVEEPPAEQPAAPEMGLVPTNETDAGKGLAAGADSLAAQLVDVAGAPTTTHGVQPTMTTGNQNCAELYPGTREVRIEPVVDGSESENGASVEIDVYNTDDGPAFDFSDAAGGTLVGVVVKGGPNGNNYDYTSFNGVTADTFLHAPVNDNNDQFYGLSHVSFCFADTVEVDKEWVVNGGAPIPDGEVPGNLGLNGSADLLLDGDDADFDTVYFDVTAGDDIEIDETLDQSEWNALCEFVGAALTEDNGTAVDESLPATDTLEAGANHYTITNEVECGALLILQKVVLNTNGGDAVPGDFELLAIPQGPGVVLSAFGHGEFEVDPDTVFDLAEGDMPDGYVQVSDIADCGAGDVTTIQIPVGTTVTCTFTNEDLPVTPPINPPNPPEPNPPVTPPNLPDTGLEGNLGPLALGGGLLVVLGVALVARGRRRDDEQAA